MINNPGTVRKTANKAQTSKAAFGGMTLGVLFVAGGVFLISAGGPVFGVLVLLFGALFLWIGISCLKDLIKNREAFKSESERNELAEKAAFYQACEEQGIEELQSASQIKKAEMLLSRLGRTSPDIKQTYEESKAAYLAIIEGDKIAAIDKQEIEYYTQSVRYAEYIGLDKRKAIVKDYLAAAERRENQKRNTLDYTVGSANTPEKDWASAGGIAAGLAGPLAGAATIAEIQSQNAEIRAQNAANRAAIAPVVPSMVDQLNSAAKAVKLYRDMLENIPNHLVADLKDEEVFSYLSFCNSKITVSPTGRIIVEVTVSRPQPLIIFDDIDAWIDGTVLGEICDEDKVVATVKLVFPELGIKNNTEKIVAITKEKGFPEKEYTVRFKPYHVWARE